MKVLKISFHPQTLIFQKISGNSLHQHLSTRKKPQNQTGLSGTNLCAMHKMCQPGMGPANTNILPTDTFTDTDIFAQTYRSSQPLLIFYFTDGGKLRF